MTTGPRLAVPIAEAAEMCSVSPQTIRKMIAAGGLRSVRLMGKTVVPVVEIERLLGVEPSNPSVDRQQLVESFARLIMPDNGIAQ